MALVLIAVMISFVAAFCFRGSGSGVKAKAKRGKRQVGWQREEMEIEPSHVPVFKPSWQNLR